MVLLCLQGSLPLSRIRPSVFELLRKIKIQANPTPRMLARLLVEFEENALRRRRQCKDERSGMERNLYLRFIARALMPPLQSVCTAAFYQKLTMMVDCIMAEYVGSLVIVAPSGNEQNIHNFSTAGKEFDSQNASVIRTGDEYGDGE